MIAETWMQALRLEHRRFPDFIISTDDISNVPHSSNMRKCFNDLGINAIHCVSGVPSIAFLVMTEYDQNTIDRIHKALWNQGILSLLFVIHGNSLKAFSLSQLPDLKTKKNDKLVCTFDLLADALELRNLVLGVESGRFIAENENRFDNTLRVDQVLLSNLEHTVKKLVTSGLRLQSAQALLMQIMFIAYLEDKEIIGAEYFQSSTGNAQLISLRALLNNRDPDTFNKLFALLKLHFNGDLFVAPCSFDTDEEVESLNCDHIAVLAGFRAGNVNLESKQMQFWPYDFRYIPIELISAVYDRFLGFDPREKRSSGAYYTPMFLADLVTEQAWSELSARQKSGGSYVDPSCGSGIFLVRLFEKMIEHWQISHQLEKPTWPSLLSMLKRIHGFDIKKEAIRVAAFSLYIALLENTRPAEILALMKKGRLLPKLYGVSLKNIDFFEADEAEYQFDLVIGNPPWVSRRGEQAIAENWCRSNSYQMPAKELAWGFAWKSLHHAKPQAVVALLFKATSFLTNHSNNVVETRKAWMRSIELKKVINLADTRFQLFDGGAAPTALMIYCPNSEEKKEYNFDYWVPKADLNLKNKRTITLSSLDKASLSINRVLDDQLLMKRRMWMQNPDAKLYDYLCGLPALGEKLITYKESKKKVNIDHGKWIIGQGFKPAVLDNLSKPNYFTTESDLVVKLPHLETSLFQPLAQPSIDNAAWHSRLLHSKGFEKGFKAPHVLIPQGIESTQGRLRASFCTQDLTFKHSIQAISFEENDISQAKFLTVLMNSSLVAWYLFHQSSNTGMERAKVHQEQLLYIPYPNIDDLKDKTKASSAFDDAVSFIDKLHNEKDALLKSDSLAYRQDIDSIIYRYFGLNETDICVIEDTLNHIVPSIQPNAASRVLPSLWHDTNHSDWMMYSEVLENALSKWLQPPIKASASYIGSSPDLVVMAVCLKGLESNSIKPMEDIDKVLPRIWKALPEQLSGNFQLIPDLRIFIDDVLYLIKPRKRRFWLRTSALADADSIASELLSLR